MKSTSRKKTKHRDMRQEDRKQSMGPGNQAAKQKQSIKTLSKAMRQET